MTSDPPGNIRIVRDETGQESWESITTELTPYGEVLRETVVNRDGSTIRSELAPPDSAEEWTERNIVTLADGSVAIFENLGSAQTIYDMDGRRVAKTIWTEHGPEPVAISSGLTEPLSDSVKYAALTLYNWLASRDRADDKVTVFAFSMDSFQHETNEGSPVSGAKPAEK